MADDLSAYEEARALLIEWLVQQYMVPLPGTPEALLRARTKAFVGDDGYD